MLQKVFKDNKVLISERNDNNLFAVFVTTALARSHYCNHVRFPNVS